MRVHIEFIMDKEEDGVNGSVEIRRDDVDSLEDLLYLFQDAAISAGYTYVESLGAYKEGGDTVWSGL